MSTFFRGFFCIFLFLVAGCDSFSMFNKPEETKEILIAGSSTMHPVMVKLLDAYKVLNPNVFVVNEQGGSTAGIIALKRGAIDMATLSRDMRHGEDAENIITVPITRNAVGFLVNVNNPVQNLSPKQIFNLLTGKEANWDSLGFKGPVHILSRKKGSTSLRVVDDLLLKGYDLTEKAVITSSAEEMAKAIASDRQAFGFASLADFSHLDIGLQEEIRFIAINGVPLERKTVLSGRYLLTTSFFFAVSAKSSPSTYSFLNFVRQPEGQNILKEIGLVTF